MNHHLANYYVHLQVLSASHTEKKLKKHEFWFFSKNVVILLLFLLLNACSRTCVSIVVPAT